MGGPPRGAFPSNVIRARQQWLTNTSIQYKLYIVTLAGNVIGTFCPEPDPGFGIRMVAWHPSGTFLAVAGTDDKVHILESLTWNPIATLELPSRIPPNTVRLVMQA